MPRKPKLSPAEQALQLLQRTVKVKTKGGERERPMSIRAVARELGVNDRTVRRWLAGDAVPKEGNAERLAKGATRVRSANIAKARRDGLKIERTDASIIPRVERGTRRDPGDASRTIKSDTIRINVGTRTGGTYLDPYFLRETLEQFRTLRAQGAPVLINGIFLAPDYEDDRADDDGGEDDGSGSRRPRARRYATGWMEMSGMSDSEMDRWVTDLYEKARKGVVLRVYVRDPRLSEKKPRKRRK